MSDTSQGTKTYLREAKYPLVCICGSTRFRKETEALAEQLSYKDHIVVMVNCWSRAEELRSQEGDNGLKDKLNDLHKAKIRLCDFVYVVNVGGYIGKSTASEIVYARLIGKTVKFLEDSNV